MRDPEFSKSRNVESRLLVLVENDLNIALATHDDRALGVNVIWHKVNDILNLPLKHTSRCDSSSLFNDHSHWDTFIQQTKLSLGRLRVGRVEVDTSVKDGTVDIGYTVMRDDERKKRESKILIVSEDWHTTASFFSFEGKTHQPWILRNGQSKASVRT